MPSMPPGQRRRRARLLSNSMPLKLEKLALPSCTVTTARFGSSWKKATSIEPTEAGMATELMP